MFEIGKVYTFCYNGKLRFAQVKEIKADSILAWDFNAFPPIGAWRTFKLKKITDTPTLMR